MMHDGCGKYELSAYRRLLTLPMYLVSTIHIRVAKALEHIFTEIFEIQLCRNLKPHSSLLASTGSRSKELQVVVLKTLSFGVAVLLIQAVLHKKNDSSLTFSCNY